MVTQSPSPDIAVAKSLPENVKKRIEKHKLPTGGSVPFIPKVRPNKRNQPDLVTAAPKKGPKQGEKGFVDSQGRIWIRDPAHAGYPDHWDVQEDDGRDYQRIGDDGEPLIKPPAKPSA